MFRKFILISCIILSGFLFSFGQAPAVINLDSTVSYKGNDFKVYNNWLNVGAGFGQTIETATSFINIGLGYNFHIKQHYFKVGASGNGEVIYLSKSNYYLVDYHACYGRRIETFRNNFALFGGLSKIKGYQLIPNLDDKIYNTFGLYAELQATQKLTYDVGLGLTIFAEYNSEIPYLGARIDLYFSNALKKRKQN